VEPAIIFLFAFTALIIILVFSSQQMGLSSADDSVEAGHHSVLLVGPIVAMQLKADFVPHG